MSELDLVGTRRILCGLGFTKTADLERHEVWRHRMDVDVHETIHLPKYDNFVLEKTILLAAQNKLLAIGRENYRKELIKTLGL